MTCRGVTQETILRGQGMILAVGKGHGAHSDHGRVEWPFQTAPVPKTSPAG